MKAADELEQSNTCTGVPLGGEPAAIKESFQSLHATETFSVGDAEREKKRIVCIERSVSVKMQELYRSPGCSRTPSLVSSSHTGLAGWNKRVPKDLTVLTVGGCGETEKRLTSRSFAWQLSAKWGYKKILFEICQCCWH